MSVIDEVLATNEIYSRTHEFHKLSPRPERKLAVLTCMDTRLSIRTLGLKEGDAHIIRNAGGIVTDDALRSLVVSHYLRVALLAGHRGIHGHQPHRLRPDAHHRTRSAHQNPEPRRDRGYLPRLLLRVPEHVDHCTIGS